MKEKGRREREGGREGERYHEGMEEVVCECIT